ncbi:DUF1107 family protein [Pseudaeromonas sp. ZJS20]|uniref:DUF1107 family protein n=1 Tax=Pseudaeromonas aegiceratis TaxID=3153928 RepID=UPI00390C7B06
MIKIFRSGLPRQIARHVMAYYQGSFFIEMEGPFRFDKGFVCYEGGLDPTALQTIARINKEVRAMHRFRP